jgi:hypothetical protein
MTKTYVNINGQVYDTADVSVPKDRAFRDAWVVDKDVIEVDMTKAREIQKNVIRSEREPVFKELDAKFMKALETGDTTAVAAIAAKKEALRDAPSSTKIKNAKTPEELMKYTLDKLVTL